MFAVEEARVERAGVGGRGASGAAGAAHALASAALVMRCAAIGAEFLLRGRLWVEGRARASCAAWTSVGVCVGREACALSFISVWV